MKQKLGVLLTLLFTFLFSSTVLASENATQTSEVLEMTEYSAAESNAIVEFDREKVLNELYSHVLENNDDISAADAYAIAIALTESFEEAQKTSLSTSNTTTYSNSTQVVIPIGQIVDNELIPIRTRTYIPDSRTSIISEGWSVTPYTKSSTLYCTYRTNWEGLDLYKSSVEGTYCQSQTSTITQAVGFDASATLSKSECTQFGLKVTGSYTATSSIQAGFTLDVPAWTKTMVRPYIYYYIDTYEGTYQYYCYNNYDKTYFYVYETRTAQNSYDTERSYRVWTRVNDNKDVNAVSPVPPTSWEW